MRRSFVNDPPSVVDRMTRIIVCLSLLNKKRIIFLKFFIFDFSKFVERDGKDNFGSSCFECKEKKFLFLFLLINKKDLLPYSIPFSKCSSLVIF